jgi:simple sugar transport system permease protein
MTGPSRPPAAPPDAHEPQGGPRSARRWTLPPALRSNEALVAVIILAFSVVTGIVAPSFFTLANVFDLLRASIVVGILAIGVLVVLLSGGIDVSFTAVAAFSMYAAILFVTSNDLTVHWAVIFAISVGIGMLLGLVNAIFIGLFRLPTLIVTLGTLSLFRGFLLAFVGTRIINVLPPSMREFSRAPLFRITSPDGVIFSLPLAFVFLVVVVALTWFILRKTMLGRAIYAYGGSPEAAERAGFSILKVRFFVYSYVGALAGLAGIIHVSLTRVANPVDLVGQELTVIAAVVLGGASIAGGRGTIVGTLLGIVLIVIVSNSLVALGIPSYWQRVAVGLLILLGTGVPAYQARRSRRATLA